MRYQTIFSLLLGIFMIIYSLGLHSNAYAVVTDPNDPNFVGPPAPKTTNNPAPNNDTTKSDILGVSYGDLRQSNVDMDTIPKVIVKLISVLLGIAGTVAVFSLIYHAVQMQINSGITGDSSGVDKAKKGMMGALIGFVIAISAWFLITRAIDLLSGLS